MAQGNRPKITKPKIVNEGRNMRVQSMFSQPQSIFNQPKPAQPKSRSQYNDQGSVNKVFGWVKANWSKPIMSPAELQKQKAYYEKEHPGMYPAFKE